MTLAPRAVVVTRPTEYETLLAAHGTRAAAAFFLQARGRDLAAVERRHAAQVAAVREVGAAVPADWRRGRLDRADLDRFLFAPEDVVVVVGQDGLVANVAKYVGGRPVVGVDPEPGRNPGVLVTHRAAGLGRVLAAVAAGAADREERTMVAAMLDDGQVLHGLNEVYAGDAGHQSSRYVLAAPDGDPERQSSSGVLVGTGTGATGWCASLAHDRAHPVPPPGPTEDTLCWYVREAWPSPATGVGRTEGVLPAGATLTLTAESDRLVVFADGIEPDRLPLRWGQRVTLGVATTRLHLVLPA